MASRHILKGKPVKTYNEIMDYAECYAWDISDYSSPFETLGEVLAIYHNGKSRDDRWDDISHLLWKITEQYANREQEKADERGDDKMTTRQVRKLEESEGD